MTNFSPLIVGLVPAAGASRRLGQDKRRLAIGNLTVLETTVNSLRQAGLSSIFVVLEENSPCADLSGLQDTTQVINPQPERGMLSSIRQGLIQIAATAPTAQAVALLPGDHPFVPSATIATLLDNWRQAQPPFLLLAPCYEGRRGHPLIIHRSLFAEAAACDDQIGLRQLVHHHENDVRLIKFAGAEAEDDLDTPEDLTRLQR